MTLDRKRWAQLASELKFSQLDTARKQAEVWRAGLAALTALLTAVFVLKGRDNVSDLTEPYETIVVGLLGLALALLLIATLWVSRALAGPAGDEILLTCERVEQWTEKKSAGSPSPSAGPDVGGDRRRRGGRRHRRHLAGSRPRRRPPLVQVTQSTSHQSCGQLIGVSDRQLILRPLGDPVLISLTKVTAITPVTACF